MVGMEITPATLQDAADIARVHVHSWQQAYAQILRPEFLQTLSIPERAQRWHEILTKAESHTLVAKQSGRVIGFISYGTCRDAEASPTQGEIWALYVEPASWRTGTGRTLVHHAQADLRRQGKTTTSLWVLAENHHGRRFYQSVGFHLVPDSTKPFELGGQPVEEVLLLAQNPG